MDTANRVEQARNNVQEITSSIDGMRSSRDNKLADIERCQQQIQVSVLLILEKPNVAFLSCLICLC